MNIQESLQDSSVEHCKELDMIDHNVTIVLPHVSNLDSVIQLNVDVLDYCEKSIRLIL